MAIYYIKGSTIAFPSLEEAQKFQTMCNTPTSDMRWIEDDDILPLESMTAEEWWHAINMFTILGNP